MAAISRGEPSAGVNPRISEWGNPLGLISEHSGIESIESREGTGGTETSQYPEEKK